MPKLNIHHGRIKMFKNYVSFNTIKDIVPMDNDVDIVTQQLMGGLLVGDSNVTRGGKINPRAPRRNIRFVI